jgi:hypothetical protein
MSTETLIAYLAYSTTATIGIMAIYYFICLINEDE